jgi:hypothetical protein
MNYVDTVNNFQGLSDIVIRYQDADPTGFKVHDQISDVADGDRVNSRERFIQ